MEKILYYRKFPLHVAVLLILMLSASVAALVGIMSGMSYLLPILVFFFSSFPLIYWGYSIYMRNSYLITNMETLYESLELRDHQIVFPKPLRIQVGSVEISWSRSAGGNTTFVKFYPSNELFSATVEVPSNIDFCFAYKRQNFFYLRMPAIKFLDDDYNVSGDYVIVSILPPMSFLPSKFQLYVEHMNDYASLSCVLKETKLVCELYYTRPTTSPSTRGTYVKLVFERKHLKAKRVLFETKEPFAKTTFEADLLPDFSDTKIIVFNAKTLESIFLSSYGNTKEFVQRIGLPLSEKEFIMGGSDFKILLGLSIPFGFDKKAWVDLKGEIRREF